MAHQELKVKRIKNYFINATMELVEKQRTSSPTARDIAALAGYSPATIYKYFGSLDGLILATADRYAEKLNREIEKSIAGETTIRGRIRKAYGVFTAFFIDNPNIFRMIFMTEYLEEFYNPELLENFLEMERNRKKMFTLLAKEYGFPRDDEVRIESILTSNMFGPLYMWVAKRLPGSPEELKENIEKNIVFVLDTFENQKENKYED